MSRAQGMDSGFRSPIVDCFRRGEIGRDDRLVAAQGMLARAHEQVALLLLLVDDPEPDVAAAATATLQSIPVGPLRAFLARDDVPVPMRDFFAARGIHPADVPAPSADDPLVDLMPDDPEDLLEPEAAAPEPEKPADKDDDVPKVLSSLPIMKRIKVAMKGTRTQRAQLIRDPNKMVSSAVLSSPKLTETEVEAFAKAGNVSEDVLRVIGMNRTWTKNYGVVHALVKNPKTPPALSMQLLTRLNDRDMKMISNDRNVPEGIRLAARKYVVKSLK